MSDQWGQQPTPNQQQWRQQPIPNQQSWGQQQLNNGWQQPPLNPGQFQLPQTQPKKKRNRLWIVLSIVSGILVLSCALCGVIESSLPKTSNTESATVSQTATPVNTSTKAKQVAQPTVRPTATPTPKPTPTSAPTKTSAQIEADYKASATSTTVDNIDKAGSADQGTDVHFTSKILKFVKDTSGNTAGANVTNPNSYSSSVIQIAFTPGTDITQLNEGDILEVWGSDQGVFSGTNAFGGTVQEVGITAKYMNDQTTNYQAGN